MLSVALSCGKLPKIQSSSELKRDLQIGICSWCRRTKQTMRPGIGGESKTPICCTQRSKETAKTAQLFPVPIQPTNSRGEALSLANLNLLKLRSLKLQSLLILFLLCLCSTIKSVLYFIYLFEYFMDPSLRWNVAVLGVTTKQ